MATYTDGLGAEVQLRSSYVAPAIVDDANGKSMAGVVLQHENHRLVLTTDESLELANLLIRAVRSARGLK